MRMDYERCIYSYHMGIMVFLIGAWMLFRKELGEKNCPDSAIRDIPVSYNFVRI